jgi:transaldolase
MTPPAGAAAPRRAVFLDRDGVLNRATVSRGVPHPPSGADLEVLPGVAEACTRLRDAGYLLIVVTNQPDVARGTSSHAAVDALNRSLLQRLPLDDVLVCPHDDGDACGCRKPREGLLLEAARTWGIDLRRSVMVGDRWRDVEAGRRAGCATVFVDHGYAERSPQSPDLVVRQLVEAVPWILDSHTAADEASGPDLRDLRVSIFADGADLDGVLELSRHPLISGFTTNPTLMRTAGVRDYEAFARELLEHIPGMPVSFEVVADEFGEMERQARRIASWGDNVYVKIPVTNTRAETSTELVRRLADRGVQLNVTAVLAPAQVCAVTTALAGGPPSYLSVFAGRVADTGRDPVPLMTEALEVIRPWPSIRLIWASPREVLNILQADAIGCHVITVTHDLLRKLAGVGKGLDQLSLETVRMFHRDAEAAGFVL